MDLIQDWQHCGRVQQQGRAEALDPSSDLQGVAEVEAAEEVAAAKHGRFAAAFDPDMRAQLRSAEQEGEGAAGRCQQLDGVQAQVLARQPLAAIPKWPWALVEEGAGYVAPPSREQAQVQGPASARHSCW